MRLMTDLEEEILFRLTTCDLQRLPVLAMKVSISMNNEIPLGVFHKTVLQLEEEGLVQSVTMNLRRRYSITQSGKEALQREWNYYKNRHSA